MNIQDKLERILRELHIMLSRAPVSEIHEEYVLVHKKEMQKTLGSLGAAVSEMMDHYEITEQARNRGELEAEKHRMEIIRNANQQAQDIYAASVMYSEDALGRIQRIIEEAEASGREMFKRLNREMAESKRVVRSNQLELLPLSESADLVANAFQRMYDNFRLIIACHYKCKHFIPPFPLHLAK